MVDLNPGPHDWKESVLTTRPSWNVIIIGEKINYLYHKMDMNFKLDLD